jgi:1-phosphofructokinase
MGVSVHAMRRRRPRACVLAPTPLLTVTIEGTAQGHAEAEVHVHAGGQGFWVARLLAELDVDVGLCATFGGETGTIVRHLISETGVRIIDIEASGANGAYVHDRRHGERREVAAMPANELTRHEVDELYGAALSEAFASDVLVLTGPEDDWVLPHDVYRRLAADVGNNGGTVVADLSGGRLEAVLEGGVDVLKVSEEELERDGRLEGGDLEAAIRTLLDDGAKNVVVSCGDETSVAWIEDRLVRVVGPRLESVDPRGAGDSLTAAMTAALVHGETLNAALAFGAAAGAVNVTRRGLATGRREQIERLARHVRVEPFSPDSEVMDRARTDHE